jgi:hypothetical protein
MRRWGETDGRTTAIKNAGRLIRPWRSASSACAKSSRPRQTAPGGNGTR